MASGSRFSSFLIQSTYGRRGNFELISSPARGGSSGFTHRWRDNDAGDLPWRRVGPVQPGWIVTAPVLLEGERTLRGRLQALALTAAAGQPTRLGTFVRRNAPSWTWEAPDLLPYSDQDGWRGSPAFFESSNGGAAGQYEVFIARASGGLVHYWRNNNLASPVWEQWGLPPRGPWRPELEVDDLAAFESSFGRFEMLIPGERVSNTHPSPRSVGPTVGRLRSRFSTARPAAQVSSRADTVVTVTSR